MMRDRQYGKIQVVPMAGREMEELLVSSRMWMHHLPDHLQRMLMKTLIFLPETGECSASSSGREDGVRKQRVVGGASFDEPLLTNREL